MDIRLAKERIKNIMANKPDSKKPLLFRHIFKINLNHDIILSKIMLHDCSMYMKSPDTNNSYFGFQNAIEYKINSKIEFDKLKKIKFEPISNIKNDNILIFGTSSFNMDTKAKFPWEEIPKAYFFIPKFLITFSKKECHLTYTLKIDNQFSEKKILNDFQEIAPIIDPDKKNKYVQKINLNKKSLLPDKETYLKNVHRILSDLENKKYSKLVLSRIEKYTLSHNIPADLIIDTIIKKHTNCFNFMIKKNNYYFIGSSPEELITLNKKNYFTKALAGTSKKDTLIYNKKELQEHEYVIEHIQKTLEPISARIDIRKNKKLLNLDYAYHLKTPIEGELVKNNHILDILNDLYPTPALAGSPIEESKLNIQKIEENDRGWFGGSVGFYTNNGNGKFYVPIRSCLVDKNEIYFYAGSGIVDGSNAKNEWDETEIKLTHMKSVIDGLIQDNIN